MYATVHKREIFDLNPMIIGIGVAEHTEFGEFFGRAG
jgi:hypothetical protein